MRGSRSFATGARGHFCKGQQAIRDLAGAMRDIAGNMPMPRESPIVPPLAPFDRNADTFPMDYAGGGNALDRKSVV